MHTLRRGGEDAECVSAQRVGSSAPLRAQRFAGRARDAGVGAGALHSDVEGRARASAHFGHDVALARVQRFAGAQLRRQRQAARLHVRDGHVRRARSARSHQRQQPHGACACDEHARARRDTAAPHGSQRHVERLQQRALLQRHAGRQQVAEGGGVQQALRQCPRAL
jgi:hypothetical protein